MFSSKPWTPKKKLYAKKCKMRFTDLWRELLCDLWQIEGAILRLLQRNYQKILKELALIPLLFQTAFSVVSAIRVNMALILLVQSGLHRHKAVTVS